MPERTVIGSKYKVLREIGRGPCGQVFEVKDEAGQARALKLLADSLAFDAVTSARFLSHAQRALELKHSNVNAVLEVAVDDVSGAPYIVSELAPGRPLSHWLRRKQFEVPDAADIGLQVLAALAAAHQVGNVHGGLRPENVFIEWPALGRPKVRVLDFGCSSALAKSEEGYPLDCYSPPEAILEVTPTPQSDVYCTSVLLYEMLAGSAMIPQRERTERCNAILSSNWAPLSDENPKLPESLVRAIESGLETDSTRRLKTTQDYARHLAPYLLGVGGSSFRHQLDPVLSVRNRFDAEGPESPSLQLERAPRPKADSACPERMLLDPEFPKSPHAPRLDSLHADAYGGSRKSGTARKTGESNAETEGAGLAVGTGLGLGAVLAWLSVVI